MRSTEEEMVSALIAERVSDPASFAVSVSVVLRCRVSTGNYLAQIL